MIEKLERIRAAASRVFEKARGFPLPLLLLAALWYFKSQVEPHYPLEKWLFWHYGLAWASALFWAAGCIATGHVIVRRVLKTTLPLLEHVGTSFATGAFAFFVAMNAVGHLQLYKPWMFFALPLAFLAIGARDGWRTLRRLRRHLAHARKAAAAKPRPFYFWPAIVFGVLGAAMVYFCILTPDNVQFDSRWKHLALAEEFAAHGGLRRFDEGFTVGTYPHLPSFFYGWAFLCPKASLFDKVEIAAHIEFVTLLGTLVSIPGLVRLFVPGQRAHLSWVARFLFPGFFLYDSNLSAGADHIGAFFVIPVFTQLIRSWKELSPRHLVILAIPLCGVGLSKYTATTLVLPGVGLAVFLRMVWALGCKLTKRGSPALAANWLVGPLASFVAILLLTLPHWLKNWVWYGDPAYPTLYKELSVRPWTQDAADLFEYGYKEYQFWRPPRTWEGKKETLKALYNFSFIPNDYPRFHGKVPTFGSLMTLLLASLFFLRRTLRIWGCVALIHFAILIWYWTHHQDRYLQAILPWMAAVTAAIIVKLWHDPPPQIRFGWVLRGSWRAVLAALVCFQIVWGGDVWFLPNHAMAGSVQKRVIDLIGMGYKKKYEERFKIFAPYTDVAKLLPKRSRVLLHDNHVHVGIGAESVSDWGGWQFGISYGRLGSPRAVWEKYKELGVTHVLWDHTVSKGWDSIGGDLVFFEFATRHTQGIKSVGRTRLGLMPKDPPDESERSANVLMVSCDARNYPPGLYEVTDLVAPVFGPRQFKWPQPRQQGSFDDLADDAYFAVVDPGCAEGKSFTKKSAFELVAKRKRIYGGRGTLDLYIRKGDSSPAEPAPADKPEKKPERPAPERAPDDDFDPGEATDEPG